MAPSTAEVARARVTYQAEMARGLGRFFLPRETRCPWCGSERLTQRLRTRDWVQAKPGEFTLDRCRDCDHTFQNPRLNAEGLDFYYRDFYDGLGAETSAEMFSRGSSVKRFHASVHAVTPHIAPRAWLDVGTALGHFPAAARQLLPDTEFHGLDMGESVEQAAEAGRISRAYRGFLTELAEKELAGQYDLVSMFHYLEHTTDPKAELAAARTALKPGGHLLIEIPNPQSLSGKVMGKYWVPWFQPQHLHFIPLANMQEELNRTGFTVVAAEFGNAHIPVDLIGGLWFVLNRVLPQDDLAWRPRKPGRAARATRLGGLIAALPLMLAVHGLDLALAPIARRTRFCNAYRLIARRN
ncbi:methyltransferase domain-containing protein [Streptomyces sp. DSM 44917]|uniref:Methyltransferase domain-containing protein n=1 Tax=Streptomyces boetiae TaxID=3075541 RepID=A0ABU2L8S0_9ACTN|nr:methyltransferase domain-containing protein [Streptomyces sp. DSM 44917]MDT0307968.1 methyltransferase domain-containing protein [Streptomyces sp. DSM 44917]